MHRPYFMHHREKHLCICKVITEACFCYTFSILFDHNCNRLGSFPTYSARECRLVLVRAVVISCQRNRSATQRLTSNILVNVDKDCGIINMWPILSYIILCCSLQEGLINEDAICSRLILNTL